MMAKKKKKKQAMDIHSYLSVSTSAEINRLLNGWFKALSSHRSQPVLPRVMQGSFLASVVQVSSDDH